MKNVFILAIVTLFSATVVSCKDNDDYQQITDVYSQKIDSVHIPMDTMSLGVTQEILAYSTFARGCEGLYSYDYIYGDNLTRSVVNYGFKTNDACLEGTFSNYSRVNFKPVETGIYTFKFWTGKDASGTNTYLEKKVVVE